ncbi:penicillin-binding protein activator [Chelativorans salis]|uniref:ABC transporter substrate-binding protein n=1 Tax=Chelativorans salis TaxID=2978478 RepID=A0ABT2LK58_9HYPH|nr:penicillin-binding protein activator [Chelativorans sp. EGI FJ00035]MCT7374641.1 ABC transporter substrate-binding protein [Chelativorans sp. EGI FJ00035]
MAVLTCMVAAGCQSSTDALGVGSGEAARGPSVETVGDGSAVIALLLPRSAKDAADYRDGAALAVEDLGGERISLTIYDTGRAGEAAAARAAEAASQGARLVIGPVSATEAEAVAAISPDKRPPVLSLATNAVPAAPDLFTFASDEVDSALDVAAYAAATGEKNILAVVPPRPPARSLERLRKGIGQRGGALVDVVEYAGGRIEVSKSDIGKADAVLILADAAPAAAVAALRATGGLALDALTLGTSAWTREDHAAPVLDEALLALPDQASLKLVADRFREAHRRPLSMQAAYAYDATAIAAGIVRAKGAEALSAATLRADPGFRGATGTFRFNADGSVERLFSIYRLSGGKPILQDPAPESF